MAEERDWEVTAKRYVGFIDIMGFKDMVAKLPHEEIYEMMRKVNEKRKLVENIEWKNLPTNLVKSTTYSDSIMLYSKDESYESLDSLISCIASLSSNLFIEGVPHKGAIALGTMSLDFENSIFFGQPLIDAYLLQEEISFYGILIHATVEKEIFKKDLKIPTFVKDFSCKLKGGIAKHLTVYPMNTKVMDTNSDYNKEKTRKLHLAISNLRLNTSGHLRKYVDNTEEYLEFIKSK